jgi:hypothetical protein
MKSREETRDNFTFARGQVSSRRDFGAQIRPKLQAREVNREGQHGCSVGAVFCVDSVLLFPRMSQRPLNQTLFRVSV